MGLLDSVIGAVAAQAGAQQQPMNGGAGLGGLGNLGPLAEVLGALLANGGAQGGAGGLGGLGGLVQKFDQAGLGELIASWIGRGENLPISGAQLGQVLGGDTLGQIARQLGLDQQQAAGQLSDLLPGLIDQMTPQGQMPAASGEPADLFGMLGGLLEKR